jgi:hypothetical protein
LKPGKKDCRMIVHDLIVPLPLTAVKTKAGSTLPQ